MRDSKQAPSADTEFLDAAMRRIRSIESVAMRADALLSAAEEEEPMLRDALRTPQTPKYHSEGPYLRDHLHLMLSALYAILDGELRLGRIEELARLGGHQADVEALEEAILENAALFEAYALVHDAAKWTSLSFSSRPGSRGEGLGFTKDAFSHHADDWMAESARLRGKYLELFEGFLKERGMAPGPESERAFHRAYGIDAHYHGHDRAIHAPAYRNLLERVALSRRLPPRDIEVLEWMIALHMDVIGAFARDARPAAAERLARASRRAGVDEDGFLLLLQGALFLDGCCASVSAEEGHRADLLSSFLRAAHAHAPDRRVRREAAREEARRREEQRRFREAGLDGIGLMEVLDLDPGPDLGRALRAVQGAVTSGSNLPRFGKEADEEISRRAERFHALA